MSQSNREELFIKYLPSGSGVSHRQPSATARSPSDFGVSNHLGLVQDIEFRQDHRTFRVLHKYLKHLHTKIAFHFLN